MVWERKEGGIEKGRVEERGDVNGEGAVKEEKERMMLHKNVRVI